MENTSWIAKRQKKEWKVFLKFIPNKMILTNTNLTYITKDDTSQVKCSIVEENNFTKIVVREDDGSDTLLYHKNDKSLNWHGIIYRLKE